MHHHRRKSGHGSANTSMTDVRKAVTASDLSSKHKPSRPAPLTRRHTPQVSQKLGKNPRDRERELEEERWFDEERDSFPTFCMTCEKQFIPQDERFLYCSDACRVHDTAASSMPSGRHASHHVTYPQYAGHAEPKDIIPRASPSRPNSTHFSPPVTPDAYGYTSAMASLRSLSIRPPSPPSPSQTYSTSLWPFAKSAATSPSTSYTRGSAFLSSTYDGAYYATAPGYTMTSSAMDRPLPSRRPGTYSRPKSIELVTPMVSR